MKQKKIISTLIIGIMLLSVMVAVAPTIKAYSQHRVLGVLYFHDGEGNPTVAPPGVEIQLVFDYGTNITTTHELNQYINGINYILGFFFYGEDGDLGSITVIYQGHTLEPDVNKSVNIYSGTEEYYLDLYVDVSGTSENDPPYEPSNPTPADGATDVGRNADLGWTGGDPDGDPVTYDVYFGTTSPPPSVATGQVGTTYDPGEMSFSTTYYWQIVARDDQEAHTDGPIWYFTTSAVNRPPNKPTLNSPADGSTVTSETSATLKVDVTDPDVDTMDVKFYNANGDVYIGEDTGVVDGGTASFTWSGRTQDKTYSWYAIADDREFTNQSDTWSFKTKKHTGSSSDDSSSTQQPNTDPVADAGGPYEGFVPGETITFNGTGSYAYTGRTIESWFWDFGDETNGSGETPTHTYSGPGEYTVILTVTDSEGDTDDDEETVTILQPNYSPEITDVTGPTEGSKNIIYNFSATAIDLDDESVNYTFDWGDDMSDSSGFLPNGTTYNITHSWDTAGKYTVRVTVRDNQTGTDIETFTMYIDAIDVGDIGYITDDDPDGTYDTFHGDQDTTLGQDEDGNYLIDEDGDGAYDWVYDPETDELTEYQPGSDEEPEEGQDYTLPLLAGVIIIIGGGFAYYLMAKNKAKKQEQAKKASQKKKSSKKSGKK